MILCSSVTRCNKPLECALKDIADAGFRDIDLIAINTWAHFNPADLAADYDTVLARVETALKQNNLTMRAMNIGMNKQMHDRGVSSVESNLKELDALCRLMKHFGVKAAALQPLQKDPKRNPEDVLKDSVDALEEYYDCTKGHGIALGLELHINSPFDTKEAVDYLYNRIPDATVVYDPTHFISMGETLEFSEFMIEHAVHVHIRDAVFGKIQTRLGEGSVDFEWIVNKLKAKGYKGNYSIEYLYNEEWDALEDAVKLRELLENIAII